MGSCPEKYNDPLPTRPSPGSTYRQQGKSVLWIMVCDQQMPLGRQILQMRLLLNQLDEGATHYGCLVVGNYPVENHAAVIDE